MHGIRVALVAAMVLLAGCGVLGGGGGGGTPTVNGTAGPPATPGGSTPTQSPATTASAGTATAAPSPTPTATPTPSATATPLPPGYETVTVENESLGIELTLTGNQSRIGDPELADFTGGQVTRGAVLECARASTYVAVATNGTVADATVSLSYNESRLPANASESDLAVFAYNDTVQFYLQMTGTVDAENDTVTATGVNTSFTSFTRETENGTETLRPTVDGTRLNNVFVVMHWPTFWEGYRTQQIPSQCDPNQG